MIQQRGTRWRVVVQAPRDELTRRRRQLSGSADSEAEARALEAELLQRAARALPERATVATVVDQWWANQPRLAPTTRLNYRQVLDSHVLPVLGERLVTDMRPRLVAAWLADLGRHSPGQPGLAPGTIRKARTVLSAVLAWAVAMEYLESNPVMKVPPPPADEGSRVAPTLEQTGRILLAAEEADPALHAYLWLAAEAGGRRGEVLGLRWGDVDTDSGVITIRRTVSVGPDGVQARARTKSGAGRQVAISHVTTAHLVEHRDRMAELLAQVGAEPPGPGDYVFSGGTGSRRTPLDGLPWRPDSTTRRFAAARRAAGVDEEVDLHGLRHTMITELLAAGVDPRTVMGRAGHSSERTTMGVYAHVRRPVDAAAAEAYGERLRAEVERLRAEAVPESATAARPGTSPSALAAGSA